MSSPPKETTAVEEDDFFNFAAARKRAENAALAPTEEPSFVKHRIFMNNVDSFNAKYIAAYLTDQVHGASRLDAAGLDEGGEEEQKEAAAATGEGDGGDVVGLPPPPLDRYEFVGTLSQPFRKTTEDVLSTVDEAGDDFLAEVLKCGYVVYDISQDAAQIPKALRALDAIIAEITNVQNTGPKTFKGYHEERVFILLSTIMTWAKTKPLDPDDPEVAFGEIDYKKRKPHPNYKDHIACERDVTQKGRLFRDKLKTYVVCCGLIYGMEEEDLDFLFRMAWYHEKYLPIFGSGTNFVPLIHVKDLAKALHGLMENTPTKPEYILAVEQTPTKLKDIVKSLSRAMGSGRTKDIGLEEAFLFKEITQTLFDRLTVNLNMEPVFISENLQVEWQNEMNLAENMDAIVTEYRQSRKLKPLRVILHGPPASGKTVLAEAICKKYGTHYVNVKTMIQETLEELNANIETERARQRAAEEARLLKERRRQEAGDEAEEDDEEEDEEAEEEEVEGNVEEWEDQIRDIEAIMREAPDGRLPDDYVVRLMKAFLGKNICQNRGYVLDGYPKTLQQARELFGFAAEGAEEEMDEGEGGGGGPGATKLLPDFVISLEADDDFLCQRVMEMPESEVQGTHYTEEQMVRRLTEFRMNNTEDGTMLNFFDENEIHPLVLAVDEHEVTVEALCERVAQCFGPPVGFALSPQEEMELYALLEEERRLEEERLQLQEEATEQQAAEEQRDRMEGWTAMLERLQAEEEKVLAARGKPLRTYLVQHVFPTLTRALIEVARTKPVDPVDFLAEQLFRENPEGSMFDPTYSRNGEMLLHDYEDQIREIAEELAKDTN